MLQSDGREVNIGYRHARLAVSPGISNAGRQPLSGFSMAAMAGATSRHFSQVLFRLMM